MVSKGPNSMSAFTIGEQMALYEKPYEAAAWQPFDRHGGTWIHEPVTICRVIWEISIFLVGTDHSIVHRYFDGTSWINTNLGGRTIHPPAVSRHGTSGIIDVFHIGRDSAVYHKSWDGKTWTPAGTNWEKVGGNALYVPTSVSWGQDHIAPFVVGFDSALYQANWSSACGWTTFNRLGGAWTGRPKAVSDKPGNIDVFGVNKESDLNHLSYTSSAWGALHTMGRTWNFMPTVVSWGPSRIDVL